MADLVAIKIGQTGVVAVQACGEDCQSHIEKLIGVRDAIGYKVQPNKHLPIWLKAGNPFFLWSWVKRGARGKRKLWEMHPIEFVLNSAGNVVAQEIPSREN